MLTGKVMKCRKSEIFLFSIFILQGCISPPALHYYTLENKVLLIEETSPLCLQVSSIRLTEALKKKEIMIRKNSVQIDYYSVHLWASSLEELLTNKINQTFLCSSLSKITPDYYLHIDVLNFEEIETNDVPVASVRFVVQFINPANMEVLMQRIYSVEKQSPGKEISDLVKVFSLCVDEILEKIYEDAKSINKPS